MCYAAYKLWNVCNYERFHYKEIGLTKYPDWYNQKKVHKDNIWYKQLPSQTAQEVCKQLDKSWKSFYALKKSGGIENPNPPRFKHEKMAITYMQNAIVHEKGSGRIRLALPRKLMEYMESVYQIGDKFLYLENKLFKDTDLIKQIKIYPPKAGVSEVIIIYEVEDRAELPDNGHYLSVDLGLHNLLTCYDSENGKTFITGRKYLSICRYYDKRIGGVQKQWYHLQAKQGVKYPRTSKQIRSLYRKKTDTVKDYLHKVTRYLVDYCQENKITRVIIGDIKNIRKGKNLGSLTNQKLHGLPYDRIYSMLEYKMRQVGILLIRQEEAYTSQCSPYAPEISKNYAQKENRRKRGLYEENGNIYNADVVGAYNILRKYQMKQGIERELSVSGLSNPSVIKVAV
jgi:putative transposase